MPPAVRPREGPYGPSRRPISTTTPATAARTLSCGCRAGARASGTTRTAGPAPHRADEEMGAELDALTAVLTARRGDPLVVDPWSYPTAGRRREGHPGADRVPVPVRHRDAGTAPRPGGGRRLGPTLGRHDTELPLELPAVVGRTPLPAPSGADVPGAPTARRPRGDPFRRRPAPRARGPSRPGSAGPRSPRAGGRPPRAGPGRRRDGPGAGRRRRRRRSAGRRRWR